MTSVTIIGAGNMGSAIAGIAAKGGSSVQVLAPDAASSEAVAKEAGRSATWGVMGDSLSGDIVVLAVPYPAVTDVLTQYSAQLDGKTVVDITNPLDFATFDSLTVPADSSAAQEIAGRVPGASVLKAFNTTLAATLSSGQVGSQPTTVLIAGDDGDAKTALASVVEAGGIATVDAGSLKRARELEALGFLQLTLAAGKKISWAGGFPVVK